MCVLCVCYACCVGYVHIGTCDIGYYSIKYGEYNLFKQLDITGYTTYYDTFIDTDQAADPTQSHQETSGSVSGEVRVDYNELLGIWCVPCPVGADCNNPLIAPLITLMTLITLFISHSLSLSLSLYVYIYGYITLLF